MSLNNSNQDIDNQESQFPQRRMGLGDIFESLTPDEILALQLTAEQVSACDFEDLPGFQEMPTTRRRRNALANIYETSTPLETAHDIQLNHQDSYQDSLSVDDRFTNSWSGSSIGSRNSIGGMSGSSNFGALRQLSDSQDEGFVDTAVNIGNSRPRQRRVALGDIFEQVPLQNGFRSRYFQLIFAASNQD